MDKRHTWIVRFDVCPEWVADGFAIDDERANDMLQIALPMAAEQHEIRAAVLCAPCPYDIAKAQGYGRTSASAFARADELRSAAPLGVHEHPFNVDCAISRAIDLLQSVHTKVASEDKRSASLAELRLALAMIRGDEDLPLHV